VFSGVRLQADSARLQEVHGWAVRLSDAVETDPSFWLITDNVPEEAYPWETIEFRGADSVRIAWEPSAADVQGAYWVYSFLHLMTRMDRMDEWFPDAVGLEGYALERFILDRTADAWLLARAIFEAAPYRPMDELVYSQDRGYLDAFLLTARGGEFSEELEDYNRANPGRIDEYLTWFRETFDREPPGLRSR
jgi:hypothetical protein